MQEILIFHRTSDQFELSNFDLGFEIEVWEPTITKWLPPNKGSKYILYWFFFQLGIFRNKQYKALLLRQDKQIVSSLLVIPTYFKWPFMQKNDVQITYVMTNQQFRGQKLAYKLIQYAIANLLEESTGVWYLTNSGNLASINLCTNLGFNKMGTGSRKSFKFFKTIKLIAEK
jgi:GNAT superfamily N-acetyltransferase